MNVMQRLFVLLLGAALLSAAGCTVVEKDITAECDNNDTLIVLDLTAEQSNEKNHQARLDSLAALQKGAVAKKRVIILMSMHWYGRSWNAYQYVANSMVIKVGRAPVTVHLTKDAYSGDSTEDQALELSSGDGIKQAVGITITGEIVEEDAALYCYSYKVVPWDYDPEAAGNQGAVSAALLTDESQLAQLDGWAQIDQLRYMNGYIDLEKRRVDYVVYKYQARPLAEVLVHEVSVYCQAKLAARFGVHPQDIILVEKAEYFPEVFEDAKKFFKEKRGVTLTGFNISGGLQYENDLVQGVIDDRADAIANISIAKRAEKALDITNTRLVRDAEADRDAAWQFLASYEAQRDAFVVELLEIHADRQQILEIGWNGQQPSNVFPVNGDTPDVLMPLGPATALR